MLQDRQEVTELEQDFNDRNFSSEDLERQALDKLNEERRKQGELRKIMMSQLNDPNFEPIK